MAKGWEHSNNPWKRKFKTIGNIFVAPPTEYWFCNKTKKLNLEVTEGYPFMSQESDVLNVDQFVCLSKSKSKWCDMHCQRSDSSLLAGINRQSSMLSSLAWSSQLIYLYLAHHPIQLHRIPSGDWNVVPTKTLLLNRWMDSVIAPLSFKDVF